jgi:hypothetical protein
MTVGWRVVDAGREWQPVQDELRKAISEKLEKGRLYDWNHITSCRRCG